MFKKFKKVLGFAPGIDYAELKKEGVTVLDVRTTVEFQSGCCDGSINIPLDQLDQKIKQLKDKQAAIVTCCASGVRSGTAKRKLKDQGFQRVYNGGSWKRVATALHNA